MCVGLFVISCNDDPISDALVDETLDENLEGVYPKVTIETPSVLKFESNEHLQNVLDKIKEEAEISDLKSEKLLKK